MLRQSCVDSMTVFLRLECRERENAPNDTRVDAEQHATKTRLDGRPVSLHAKFEGDMCSY